MTGRSILLLEPTGGISGDMFVAAAAALAGCEAEVATLPERLGLAGVTCAFSTVSRGGLQARRFEPRLGGHPLEHDAHHHAHRPLSAIRDMIRAAGLEPGLEARALRMVTRLGEVEAGIHGVPLESVHFHEVGAANSIVDIVAAALCIERLQPAAVYSMPVCTGSGTVRTAHGILPVPAPATERLLQGMPVLAGDLTGEWTTPTGALILAELAPEFRLPALVTVTSAYGAGTRDPEARPNVLRLRLCEMP